MLRNKPPGAAAAAAVQSPRQPMDFSPAVAPEKVSEWTLTKSESEFTCSCWGV